MKKTTGKPKQRPPESRYISPSAPKDMDLKVGEEGYELSSYEARKTHAKALRQSDLILAQQFAVRRFQAHHGADFEKLMQLRQQLARLLEAAIPEEGGREWFFYPKNRLLCATMAFIEDTKNRRALSKSISDDLKGSLRTEFDDIARSVDYPVLSQAYIDDVRLDEIMTFLSQSTSFIDDLISRLNFFRYYSLFSMTSLVPGKTMYEHVFNASIGRMTLLAKVENLRHQIDPQSFWMFTQESRFDDHLSAVIDTACYEPRTLSSNVQIFSGSKNKISIDDVALKDQLVLVLPTASIPEKIDAVIHYLQNALLQELEKNQPDYDATEESDFNHSLFLNQLHHTPFVLKSWGQLNQYLVAFWVFDVVQSSGKRPDQALEEIHLAIERMHDSLSINPDEKLFKMEPFTYDTIETYYLDVKRQISPARNMRTKIDQFLCVSPDNLLG